MNDYLIAVTHNSGLDFPNRMKIFLATVILYVFLRVDSEFNADIDCKLDTE